MSSLMGLCFQKNITKYLIDSLKISNMEWILDDIKEIFLDVIKVSWLCREMSFFGDTRWHV